jgi:hypothetical protein
LSFPNFNCLFRRRSRVCPRRLSSNHNIPPLGSAARRLGMCADAQIWTVSGQIVTFGSCYACPDPRGRGTVVNASTGPSRTQIRLCQSRCRGIGCSAFGTLDVRIGRRRHHRGYRFNSRSNETDDGRVDRIQYPLGTLGAALTRYGDVTGRDARLRHCRAIGAMRRGEIEKLCGTACRPYE